MAVNNLAGGNSPIIVLRVSKKLLVVLRDSLLNANWAKLYHPLFHLEYFVSLLKYVPVIGSNLAIPKTSLLCL